VKTGLLSRKQGTEGLAGHFLSETRIHLEFPNHSSPSPGKPDNWHRKEKEINTSPSCDASKFSARAPETGTAVCSYRGGAWRSGNSLSYSWEVRGLGQEPRTQSKAGCHPTCVRRAM
jgi:hypothetical protein